MEFIVNQLEYDSLFKVNRYLNHPEGQYFFFRTQCLNMQKELQNYYNLKKVPLVFLHGNPHIDNYARVGDKAGMVDFDRSRRGPYVWDIIRLLSAMSLKWDTKKERFLPKSVIERLYDGYSSRLKSPEKGFKPLKQIMSIEPEPFQKSMSDYIQAEKKWAKKLMVNELDIKDPYYSLIMEKYAASRNEATYLNKYKIHKVSQAQGTLGNIRHLLWLKPKDGKKGDLLFDAKEVYKDEDTEYFYNPYKRHAHRMVEASKLYAPGVEKGLGYALIKGKELWIREIPYSQIKLKGMLSAEVLTDFAYEVGCQLGVAHGQSALFYSNESLREHFNKNYTKIVDVAEDMTIDLLGTYEKYIDKAKKTLSKSFSFLDAK